MSSFLLLLLISGYVKGYMQSKIDQQTIRDKMQWFADAKLGIFIHAGIYAMDGIVESRSFHNKKISHADFTKQFGGFMLGECRIKLIAGVNHSYVTGGKE